MIKEGIHINGIYRHYKGSYYKVEKVAYHHEDAKPIVVYSKCNHYGIYISIRDKDGNLEVHQPFYRELEEFKGLVVKNPSGWFGILSIGGIKVERFKFINHA